MGFIPRLDLLLCAPPPGDNVGGGYLYNRSIAGFPGVAYELLAPSLLARRLMTRNFTHVLLDSLYLNSPAELSRAIAGSSIAVGLMAHLLPSCNLDRHAPAEQARAEAQEALLLSKCAYAVAPSRGAAAELQRLGLPLPSIGVASPAPICTPLQAGEYPLRTTPTRPSQAPLRFLSVGNLSRRKNLVGLLPAFSAIRGFSWSWNVVLGDTPGETRTQLRAVLDGIQAAGLSERVSIVLQPRPAQLRALYEQADCFVLAPLTETYGIVFAEALAWGCAVVAPEGPPFEEYLSTGHNALLCRTEVMEDWIEAFTLLLTNQAFLSRLKDAAVRSPAARRRPCDTAADIMRHLAHIRPASLQP